MAEGYGRQEALRRIAEARASGAEELSLAELDLEELPSEVGQLTKLSILDLSFNRLSALPDWLSDLKGLRNLDLSRNELSALPDWLGGLTGLRTLDLSGNGLSALPDSLGGLTGLQSLDLSGNGLSALPDWLGGLISLWSLDLSGNGLIKLPDSLGSLISLQHLILSGNRLINLPDWLGSLAGLQHLDLIGNDLIALPDSFGRLTRLHSLYLSGNSLITLPSSFGDLTKLQHLYLTGNDLKALPDSFSYLTSLQILSFGLNGLRTLPNSLVSLTNLQSLDVARNNLTALPDWLGGLTGLQSLDLSWNGLLSLPDSLGSLASLEEGANNPFATGLSLENNPLPAPYPALIAPGQPAATHNVLAWLRGELDPATLPDAVVENDEAQDLAQITEQRPAAYRFGLRNGRIDALPETSAPTDPDVAADLVAELAEKARELSGRLAAGNADPRVRRSVDRLLDALTGPSLRPGVLLSRSRSIEADRDAFDTPEGRAELFPDAIAQVNDVVQTLRDLMGLYPTLRAIEVERLALDIQRRPDYLADIAAAADAIADAASRSELVAPAASAAMMINDVAIADASTVETLAALIADKLLVEGNFVREVVRLHDEAAKARHISPSTAAMGAVREALGELGRKSWKEVDARLPVGVGAAAELLPVVVLSTLMAWLSPSVAFLAASIVGFKALSSAIKRSDAPKQSSQKTKPADDSSSPIKSKPSAWPRPKPNVRKRKKPHIEKNM